MGSGINGLDIEASALLNDPYREELDGTRAAPLP